MVELMIAVGVLLVAVIGAFGAQMLSMNLIASSRESMTAGGDLQSCMERLLLLQLDQIPIAGSDFEADTPVAAYTDLNLENERITPAYPGFVVGQPVPDPLPVVLTLDWTDTDGRPRSIALRSMKVR